MLIDMDRQKVDKSYGSEELVSLKLLKETKHGLLILIKLATQMLQNIIVK